MSLCGSQERLANWAQFANCSGAMSAGFSRNKLPLAQTAATVESSSYRFGLIPATAATAATMTTIFAWSHRTGFSDRHIAPTVFGSIEFLNGIGGFLVRRHLDETEAFTAAGVTIRDDFCRLNVPRLREDFLQSFIRCIERKVTNI